MAKSEWQVFTNVFGGEYAYRVGRIKNTAEPLHGGNVEYYEDDNTPNKWTNNQSEAVELANKLNYRKEQGG